MSRSLGCAFKLVRYWKLTLRPMKSPSQFVSWMSSMVFLNLVSCSFFGKVLIFITCFACELSDSLIVL